MRKPSLDRAARKRLKQNYVSLRQRLVELLVRHDPIYLTAIGAPADEYEPEVGTILPRLLALQRAGWATVPAVRLVVHEEFVRWFDADIAGAEERYAEIAAEICAVLKSGEPD